MEIGQIIKNVTERLDIDRLNDMQRSMAQTDATRIILIAPTGSGKTLAFAIRLLRCVDLSAGRQGVRGVVITPSRELTLQVSEVIRRIARGLKVTPLYGGHRFEDEVNTLSVIPDIIVATPGRLLDHLNRHTLSLDSVRALVLDEYDKSIELGFADEMSRIVRRLRHLSLVMLTSATAVTDLPDWIVTPGEPFEVADFSAGSGAPESDVQVVKVPSPVADKLDTLVALLQSMDNQRVIIFVNHRESAERVYERLRAEHLPVGLYHGALEQSERRHAVTRLTDGSTPVMVATDLAARGLDIPQVESVIHYHLPQQPEVWTHRNGRTARQGADGSVYAITSDCDNLPEFVRFDREYYPKSVSDNGIRPIAATLHINAGRKEKVSRGDIVGFLTKVGGLAGSDIGRIVLDDHEATVAVPHDGVDELIERLRPERLKGKRVRVSRL